MFGVEAIALRRVLFLVGWLVGGSAWACGTDDSELAQAISAGVFEVIGSSATHLALREYTEHFCDDDEPNCLAACNYPGVGALAKKFATVTGQDLGGSGITLHFIKYAPGVPIHLVRKAFEKSFPIYELVRDKKACTTEPAALDNLQKAKAFAASVGIDLKRPVKARRLKTPKLAAEACLPGSGSKDCYFSHDGVPGFAGFVYSLNNPALCPRAEDEGCLMPSSTAMQLSLGYTTRRDPTLAMERVATAAQIIQDRLITNVVMNLEPLVAFSTEGREVLGVIFKFSYGCGAPLPSMHLVVVPSE